MKRTILILLFGMILNSAFGQKVVWNDSIDISGIVGSDTVLYKLFSKTDDGFNLEFTDLHAVARACNDSISVNIGTSITGTTFNEWTSTVFPYTIAGADTAICNGTYLLTKMDFGSMITYKYLAIQIKITGDCRTGTIKWQVIKRNN
jgi:hypothetical protein